MDGNTMALGKRNNGNFRLSSVEVGAPRIWIHLNRIRKKQMEEKIGTGHSLHDVVSLQLFSSHLNQSEPHSNHVNRRKTRTPAPNCSSSSTIHARKQAYTPALVRRNGIRRFQGENTKGKTQRQKIETQKIVRQKS